MRGNKRIKKMEIRKNKAAKGEKEEQREIGSEKR